MRRCERGGSGRRQASCLFWTLGHKQVGIADIIGWRDVLAPALRDGGPVSLWPFDGVLSSLLVSGKVVIAETYPAESCRWFSKDLLGSKRDRGNRRKSGASLLGWADNHDVVLANCLTEDIQSGFSQARQSGSDIVRGRAEEVLRAIASVTGMSSTRKSVVVIRQHQTFTRKLQGSRFSIRW